MNRATLVRTLARFMNVPDIVALSATCADVRAQLMSEEGCERIARDLTNGNVGARTGWMTWRAFVFALHERATFAPNHDLGTALITSPTSKQRMTAREAREWMESPKFCDALTRWVLRSCWFRRAYLKSDLMGNVELYYGKSRVRMLLRGDVIWIAPQMTDDQGALFRAMCRSDPMINALYIWDGERAMRCEFFMIPPPFASPINGFTRDYFAKCGALGMYKARAKLTEKVYTLKVVALR